MFVFCVQECLLKILPLLLLCSLERLFQSLIGHAMEYYNWLFFVFQMRDLKAVGMKFAHLVYPKKNSTLLQECKKQAFLGLV